MKKFKDWCTLFPDELFGLYYGNCCKNHDEVYSQGDGFKAKVVGDFKLFLCVASRSWKLWFAALAMYVAVSVVGIYYWIKAKNDS